MKFKQYLEDFCISYKDLYILEEYGDKTKIEKVVKPHGKKTEGRVLIYSTDTKTTTEHSIYVSNRGYSVLRGNRKYKLEDFK